MSKGWLEPHFKVGSEDSAGGCITVCPCPDNPDTSVLIHTASDHDRKWFGELSLSVSKEVARSLAEAINRSVDELEMKSM